jgi:3-deoxy-D-manno-octulosonic-acid transferase
VYLLYSLLLALAFVAALPFYAFKGWRSGKYLRNFRERLGRLPPALDAGGRPSVWVHAVSVGEVLAARELVRTLKARLPGHGVFVSTTTETGQEVARRTLPEADGIFYAPFDWPGPVRAVLARLRPRLLVLVETELWPNLIRESRRAGARVAVVNGRLSPRSFPRYRLVRGLLQTVLREVDLFLMQAEPHAERARLIGAPAERVRVSGNLKFDALKDPQPSEALRRLIPAGGPLWVAGSTVSGEEELVAQAFAAARAAVPDLRLLLAPRHPERFASVPAVLESQGLRCQRRTLLSEPWRDAPVLVLDTLGELAQAYPLATVVFVGGSLLPAGGHNVLEPAAAGRAVIVGPHMENFQEIADEFLADGALVQVADADALGREVVRLTSDAAAREALGRRARDLVDRNRGALQRTVDALVGLLP